MVPKFRPAAVPNDDALAQPPQSVSSAEDSLVESFTVEHFIDQGDTMRHPGAIGIDSAVAHEGDAVQVHARFRQPSYCYLIAFNTDGSEQLGYPADAAAPPQQQSELHFPPGANQGFRLTDGAGQQAFVLVASSEPLPEYQTWRASLGDLPWRHATAGEAFHFDGRTVRRLVAAGSQERGDIVNLKAPFHQLCHTLQSQTPTTYIRALAFPVLPR
jgi:hypothetical protein